MLSHRTRCIPAGALARSTPGKRAFSRSVRRNGYDDTIQNLKIGAHTRVIFQGFTGKQVRTTLNVPFANGDFLGME